MNCDICMCIVNNQFEHIEFVFDSVYVDLQYGEIYLIFIAGYVCLCGVCSCVVVLGLSVCDVVFVPYVCSCCGDFDACTVICVACVYAVRVRGLCLVMSIIVYYEIYM